MSARLAIVHDHLTQLGGAEQVVRVMRTLYPEAPLYTLTYDKARLGQWFNDDVHTSFLQHLPGSPRFMKMYLPLMPGATESLDLRAYDVVFSSASSFAKGVVTRPDTIHICYCHTPTRYLWGESDQYIRELPYPWIVKRAAALTLPRLRAWDLQAATRPTIMLANSAAVAKRIAQYYDRPSRVLYPPVNIERFAVAPVSREKYFLTGGRLVSYKRFDIVVEAFNRLKLPLKIFGIGPDAARLKHMARSNIEFLGFVPGEALPSLYAEAVAFIHPQEEDFGITAVEAMAAGRPVIAYAAGGALETIIDGVTGTFIDEQSWEAIGDVVLRFRASAFSPATIRASTERFSVQTFADGLREIMATALARA